MAAAGGDVWKDQPGEAGESNQWGVVEMDSIDKEHGKVIQLVAGNPGCC